MFKCSRKKIPLLGAKKSIGYIAMQAL